MTLFLDTHVLIWLYQRDATKFSRESREVLDSGKLFIPAISFLEIQFLKEIKRITFTPNRLFDELQLDLSINYTETDVMLLSKKAVEIDWTRDPFDRLIVAEVILHNAKLMTKDAEILSNFPDAIWL